MSRFKKRLRMLWRRRQLDRALEDELSFHLAMKAKAGGDELEARRSLGNPTALKEQCRGRWTFAAIETCWQDAANAFDRWDGNASPSAETLVRQQVGSILKQAPRILRKP